MFQSLGDNISYQRCIHNICNILKKKKELAGHLLKTVEEYHLIHAIVYLSTFIWSEPQCPLLLAEVEIPSCDLTKALFPTLVKYVFTRSTLVSDQIHCSFHQVQIDVPLAM